MTVHGMGMMLIVFVFVILWLAIYFKKHGRKPTPDPEPTEAPRPQEELPRMALKTPDNQKLMKLLALTTSPNDNEALAALRKANQILKAQHKSWEQLLSEAPDKSGDPLFDTLKQMLAYCSKRLGPCEALTIVNNLQHKVSVEGSVGGPDIMAIHKMYNRVRKEIG